MLSPFARLDGGTLTIVFSLDGNGAPGIIYLGPRLANDENLQALADAARFGPHESQPDEPVPGGILPQSTGTGHCAVVLRRGEHVLATEFALTEVATGDDWLTFTFVDQRNRVQLRSGWRVGSGDVVTVGATLINPGESEVCIDRLASFTLPLPDWVTSVTRFSGRWSNEMRMSSRPIEQGFVGSVAPGGRPGFGGGNWLLLGEEAATAEGGRLIGAHLAWSGGHECLVEQDAEGGSRLHMAPRLESGEVVIAPSGSFSTPEACFALSASGRNGLRRAFHAKLRCDVLPERQAWGPRKVHLNSWEALGFDLDEDKATALAEAGAGIGAERFVLDDGWFAGRASDQCSLGDWSADSMRFPRGLNHLIDAVHACGMDFGLWIEPEMVSPDSDLYRRHPDWCIHLPDRARPTQRNQLVLDFTRPEVFEHVLETFSSLLSGYRIAYLKWDHNRELFPNPRGHAQALAVLRLIDALCGRFRQVEIESCASGGGRVSFDLLRRCHRVWPSDNNDPVERMRINAAWSLFLPPEVIGSHVGPTKNPVTGRMTPIGFRSAIATFGHMGVEADPRELSEPDRRCLAMAIERYKQWRDVIHSGEWRELELAEPGLSGHLISSRSRSLAIAASVGFAPTFNTQRVRLPGFDRAAIFRVRLLEPWPVKSAQYLHDPEGWREGHELSGAALAENGLALPLAHPHTAWLIGIERIQP